MAWKASINRIDRVSDKLLITIEYSDGIHDSIRDLVESPRNVSEDWLESIIKTRLEELSIVDSVEQVISQNKVEEKIYELHVDTREIVASQKPAEEAPALEDMQAEIK